MRSIGRAVVLVLAAGVVLAGAAALVESARRGRPGPAAASAPSAAALDRTADRDEPALPAAEEGSSKGLRIPTEVDPAGAHPIPPPPSWAQKGIRSAPVRGRAVDAGTGRPMAGLTFELKASLLGIAERGESKWLEEDVVTDADGRFASLRSFPEGRVSARCRGASLGYELEDSRHAHLASASGPCEWTVRVAMGPQLALRIAGAGEIVAARWRARLIEATPSGEERKWRWRTLEPGDPPRLAYSRRNHDPMPSLTPRVEVRSDDGVWVGEAAVATPGSEYPEEVFVSARRVGVALEGRTVGRDGSPMPGVDVWIDEAAPFPRDEAERASRRGGRGLRRSARTDGDGRYRLEDLPPGEYRLIADSAHHESRSQRVAAAPGVVSVPDFVFAGVAGSIAGAVRFPAEAGRALYVLELRSLDGAAETRREVRLDPTRFSGRDSRDGEFPFAFDHVPPGAHELVLLPPYEGAFEPVRRVVSAPAQGLELRASRRIASRRITLDVRDRETGRSLDATCTVVGRGFLWSTSWRSRGGDDRLEIDLLEGSPGVVHVGASGYRPAVGDPGAILGRGDEAEVLLETGWGGVLEFRRRSDERRSRTDRRESASFRPPGLAVEGVDVFADGELVGRSDRDGLVLLSLPERPRKLTAVKAGWRVDGSNLRRRLSGRSPHAIVTLAPE